MFPTTFLIVSPFKSLILFAFSFDVQLMLLTSDSFLPPFVSFAPHAHSTSCVKCTPLLFLTALILIMSSFFPFITYTCSLACSIKNVFFVPISTFLPSCDVSISLLLNLLSIFPTHTYFQCLTCLSFLFFFSLNPLSMKLFFSCALIILPISLCNLLLPTHNFVASISFAAFGAINPSPKLFSRHAIIS